MPQKFKNIPQGKLVQVSISQILSRFNVRIVNIYIWINLKISLKKKKIISNISQKQISNRIIRNRESAWEIEKIRARSTFAKSKRDVRILDYICTNRQHRSVSTMTRHPHTCLIVCHERGTFWKSEYKGEIRRKDTDECDR